jgi:hypothetical protein
VVNQTSAHIDSPLQFASGKGSRLARTRATVLIALCCALATAWLVFATARIENSYLDNYGFFFDPAAFYVHNIQVFRNFQDHGLWHAAWSEVATNAKCPARTLPYLFLAPDLLVSTNGHFFTEAPLVFLFLTLLGSTIYSQTKSIYFAMAATATFVAVPLLYHPVAGMGAYWLDFTAACAIGSAALCLIRYLQSKHLIWMLSFGALASAAALCRWSSAFYLAAFALPAVPLVLVKTCGKDWKGLMAALSCALITGFPGVAFVLNFWQVNMDYYRDFGFALNAPVSESASWILGVIQEMLGWPLLCLLSGLTLVGLLSLKRKIQTQATLVVICLWLPVSMFMFLCLIAKTAGGIHPFVYFVPALFVCAYCTLGHKMVNRMRWHIASTLLIVVAAGCTVHSYEFNRRLSNHAPPVFKAEKDCDVALAKLIISSEAASFAQFNAETVRPHLEVIFHHKKTVGWLVLFSMHEVYLKGRHPGQTPQQIAVSIYAKTKQTAALVAVFADPEQAVKPGVFNNSYSSTVAKHVSYSVAHDRDWKLIGNVESPNGRLSVYKNLVALIPPNRTAVDTR